MASEKRWPASVTPLGKVAVGSLLWRMDGSLHLTILAKARFIFTPGQTVAKLVDPAPLVLSDIHHGNNPIRSLRLSSDLVPYRPKCDVWLTGNCYTTPGKPAPVVDTRLTVYRTEDLLVDKKLRVVGDRKAPTDEPAPFERMSLTYERAYGGVGVEDNPMGVGKLAGSAPPNIVDPKDDKRPASYGPLAAAWRAQRCELTSDTQNKLRQPIIEIPEGFAWSFYQAAPADQQTDYLKGDEWLLLEGLHPEQPRLQVQLPSARARAKAWAHGESQSDPGFGIELVADTLVIYTDDEQQPGCSITWRGRAPVESEQVAEGLRIGVGITTATEQIDFNEVWTDHAPVSTPAPLEGDRFESTSSGTLGLSAAMEKRRAEQPPESVGPVSVEQLPTPFELAEPQGEDTDRPTDLRPAPMPGAPWSERQGAAVVAPLPELNSTLGVGSSAQAEDEARAALQRAIAEQQPPAADQPQPDGQDEDPDYVPGLSGTLGLEAHLANAPQSQPLPFDAAESAPASRNFDNEGLPFVPGQQAPSSVAQHPPPAPADADVPAPGSVRDGLAQPALINEPEQPLPTETATSAANPDGAETIPEPAGTQPLDEHEGDAEPLWEEADDDDYDELMAAAPERPKPGVLQDEAFADALRGANLAQEDIDSALLALSPPRPPPEEEDEF